MRVRLPPIIIVLFALAGCRVSVPAPQGIRVAVHAQVRAEARLPPPAPPVAIEGAEVVEFFGIPLDGAQDVVFVLDRSGSMTEAAQGRIAQIGVPTAPTMAVRKIDVAHEELIAAIDRLPEGTRINVIFFNRDLDAYAASMVPLDDAGRADLAAFVREMEPTGSTALATALRAAFLMNARRVVVLSDGLGNVGGGAQAILRDAREAMRGGVRVDTIGLGAHQDSYLLQALAQESGGLYQAL